MDVEIFTKPGCDCCETAMRKLMLAAYDHEIMVRSRDISDDAMLMARYGNDLPIVFFDGKLRFRREVNDALLKKLLARTTLRV